MAAAARIGEAVVHTPCLRSETLSRIVKADVWLKFENLQFTASFKERCALNTLLQLNDNERGRGATALPPTPCVQSDTYPGGVKAVGCMKLEELQCTATLRWRRAL